ncbi:ABC transporter permease [Acidobacteriota bacterium]
MFNNYLKIAWRNIRKHKVYSFINISGLTIGIACSILIFLWVLNQSSYDRFHENADRIYRIAVKGSIGNTKINYPSTPAILAEKLKDVFPEVEETVKIRRFDGAVPVSYYDRPFNQKNIFTVDSSFFNVFTCSVLHGDTATALNEPNTAVITKEMGDKYFGAEDPMGKTLTLFGNSEYIVTGIVESFPSNSHFHFDLLISAASFQFSQNTDWLQSFFRTYVLLREGASSIELEAKFPDFIKSHAFFYNQFEQGGYDRWASEDNFWEYHLQPLTDIHLHSNLSGEFEANGNAMNVSIFTITAVFILLIACINFVNLTTARSSLRAREIGVRKVVGSSRLQLIKQYLIESFMLSFLALLLGVTLVQCLLPYFRNFTGCDLSIHVFQNWIILPGLTAFGLLIGLLSGCYPAFYLSALRPVSVLKGKPQEGLKRSWLRNGLVVFQFSISIILIIGTCIVYKQLKYIQNTKLGFEKEQVVVIQNARNLGGHRDSFKESLLKNPGIIQAAASQTLPGKHFINWLFSPEGLEPITLNVCLCDEDFLKTLKMEMAIGRFFNPELRLDREAIILNETAANLLGWENPLGKKMKFGEDRTVIGVVKDFYYESMRESIRPAAFILFPGSDYVSVRIRPDDVAGTIGIIEEIWNQFLPGQPFEYSFLDEDYDSIYRNEQQMGRLFTLFSFLAIFIASFGLLGLTSFTAQQRTKEIGIRKVFGASYSKIVFLLSKEFLRWIILANIISWPVAWYFMDKWLQTFAYRTNMSLWLYGSAGFLAMIIALVTVSIQTIKAARANPIDSLRYE